ncbi:MAG: transposase [Eubacteriaceae bacterium]|nr:transposase [Eubacteriaceae bacterium]
MNEPLEKEADELLNAASYERSVERAGYRAGHYGRGLTTSSGQIAFKMPKLKGEIRDSNHRVLRGGMREPAGDWRNFFLWLRGRGLKGVRLVVGDKRFGLGEAAKEVFGRKCQRCLAQFSAMCSMKSQKQSAGLWSACLKLFTPKRAKRLQGKRLPGLSRGFMQ